MVRVCAPVFYFKEKTEMEGIPLVLLWRHYFLGRGCLLAGARYCCWHDRAYFIPGIIFWGIRVGYFSPQPSALSPQFFINSCHMGNIGIYSCAFIHRFWLGALGIFPIFKLADYTDSRYHRSLGRIVFGNDGQCGGLFSYQL